MKVLEITHDYYDTDIYRKLFEKLDVSINYCVAIPIQVDSQRNDFSIGKAYYYNVKGIKTRRFGLLANAKRCMDIISKKIDLKEIDLIHAHFLSDAIIAFYIKRKYRIPFVTSIRGSCCNDFIFSKKLYRRAFARFILAMSSSLVFISPKAKERVINSLPHVLSIRYEKKSRVIPNGIDEYWHTNKPDHHPAFDIKAEIKVITVASINKNKNQLAVAKALHELYVGGFKIKYYLYGEIQDESVYNELESFEFVEYGGVKTKEQLVLAYRRSDIFILLSFSETFGLVYAEALSQGIPVIFSEGQGFDGQVREIKIGAKAMPDDISDIKNAILHVINNYQELQANCVIASRIFDWSNSSKKLINLYRSVLYDNESMGLV